MSEIGKASIDYQTRFTKNITELVEIEKKSAIANYGLYKNDQEFLGAILEEYEEASEEFEPLQYLIKSSLLTGIRYNANIVSSISSIKRKSIQTIQELIQVICCCDKYTDGLPVRCSQDYPQEAKKE